MPSENSNRFFLLLVHIPFFSGFWPKKNQKKNNSLEVVTQIVLESKRANRSTCEKNEVALLFILMAMRSQSQ